MTMPLERTRALLHTEEFLKDLCSSENTPDVPQYIRDRAKACLRHFPEKSHLDLIASNFNHPFLTCPFAPTSEKF